MRKSEKEIEKDGESVREKERDNDDAFKHGQSASKINTGSFGWRAAEGSGEKANDEASKQ